MNRRGFMQALGLGGAVAALGRLVGKTQPYTVTVEAGPTYETAKSAAVADLSKGSSAGTLLTSEDVAYWADRIKASTPYLNASLDTPMPEYWYDPKPYAKQGGNVEVPAGASIFKYGDRLSITLPEIDPKTRKATGRQVPRMFTVTKA